MLQAQIFTDKDELNGDKYLYETLVEFLLKRGIAGATVMRGIMGFGIKHYLKKPNNLFSFDEPPIIITFVDNDDKVKEVITDIRKYFKGGLIITTPVEKW